MKSTRARRRMQRLRQKGTKAGNEPQSNYDSDNNEQVLNAYNKPGVMLVRYRTVCLTSGFPKARVGVQVVYLAGNTGKEVAGTR